MSDKTPIYESSIQEEKEKIKNSSRELFISIKSFVNELKNVLDDDARLEETLDILHGRFSKLELNIVKLEKMEE